MPTNEVRAARHDVMADSGVIVDDVREAPTRRST
jgi:hypothetical protein